MGSALLANLVNFIHAYRETANSDNRCAVFIKKQALRGNIFQESSDIYSVKGNAFITTAGIDSISGRIILRKES